MKYLILIVCLFASLPGNAQQCFCLKSTAAKGFTLKMALEGDDWKTGTVQYKGQSGTIPLKFVSTKELERHTGRPSYFQYTWNEVIDGKVTGTYVVCVQGANVYDSWYVRGNDKKKFKLERVAKDDECTECLQ